MNRPKEVTRQEAEQIIKSKNLPGCFFLNDGEWYVGIDNRTGEAWTEDFRSKEECLLWLQRTD